jgi:hypothetical protein
MTEDNGHAGQGSVLLDIGADVGALVVLLPAALVGAEIEARAVGAHAHPPAGHHHHDHGHGHVHHPHAAVVPRPTPGGDVLPSLVIQLPAGRHRLHVLPDGPAGPEVTVTGGEITELTWWP